MELPLLSSPTTPCISTHFYRDSMLKLQKARPPHVGHQFETQLYIRRQRNCFVPSALPETAASVFVAAIAVGTAATLLTRTTKASESVKTTSKTCEDCGGSGICAICNGEGFVLKKMSDGTAEKARLAAKNMATRYTARPSKEMELLHKVLINSFLYYLWREWAVNLINVMDAQG